MVSVLPSFNVFPELKTRVKDIVYVADNVFANMIGSSSILLVKTKSNIKVRMKDLVKIHALVMYLLN